MLLVSLLLVATAVSQDRKHSGDHYPVGCLLPSEGALTRKAFTGFYSKREKQASWVAEKLSRKPKVVDASKYSVQSDAEIDARFEADLSSFKQSHSYIPGLLASAELHCENEEDCLSVHLSSNMVPMHRLTAATEWKRLSRFMYEVIGLKEVNEVYSVSGSIFRGKNGELDLDVVGNMPVPTDIFRVVRVVTKSCKTYSEAFLVPNSPLIKEPSLKELEEEIEVIEKHTGLDFACMRGDDRICGKDGLVNCTQSFSSDTQRVTRLLFRVWMAKNVNELRNSFMLVVDGGIIKRQEIIPAFQRRAAALGHTGDLIDFLFPTTSNNYTTAKYKESLKKALTV